MRRIAIAVAIIAATAAAPAAVTPARATARVVLGPPWISIEYPGNPFDRDHHDAYLYVHTFHHQNAINTTPRGTAEGIVGGQRRSIALAFEPTSRPGTFALRQQWPREGTWMLVIATGPAEGSATALVDIGPAGDVTAVRVPSVKRGDWTVPTAVSAADVDAALRARATQLARSAPR